MRSHPLALLTLLAAGLATHGCASGTRDASRTAEAPPADVHPATAMADLSPTAGNTVRGTVTFTQEDGGVRVVADLAGLTPGDHGMHIHERGDCSATDASSAGDHFNPTGAPHGGPDAAQRHEGDLGNITADASGNARYERVDPMLSLEGDQSIVGRAIVVHAGSDDMSSQPAGNSGPRSACGVIVRVGNGGGATGG
jgi:Cu-Zn family superoxide dismutase